MASSKRIGFFWGEEKITIVEYDRNSPQRVISAPLASKIATPSPFSSNLTEEIQVTAVLQRLLQDNQISGGSFYVSLPMKDIILRSFVIPYVGPEEVDNVIKFEAKKYVPFDIQDLSYVYSTIPFMEDQVKRLQIIFFATRKEVLATYDRILKQVNAQIAYSEPYMVSLSKALLYKKEIKPTDQLAFLFLDKTSGRICFIDKGIPQFIREFSISPSSQTEGMDETVEELNSRIVNEVGNSFDFYSRQFSGDKIDQMLISTETLIPELLRMLETELKVRISKFTPVVIPGLGEQNSDMDAIYAMGACVSAPMDTLSEFNFLEDKKAKSKINIIIIGAIKSFREIIIVFLICILALGGFYYYLQSKFKVAQEQNDQLTSKQGAFANESLETIQTETEKYTDELDKFQKIRVKSNLVFIMLRVASHLPQGALLSQLNIRYNEGDSIKVRVNIDMSGDVFNGDPNDQIAMINQIFSDLKNDKELFQYIKNVNLDSMNREEVNDQKTTGFTIHCN